jgi:hypothetical protein
MIDFRNRRLSRHRRRTRLHRPSDFLLLDFFGHRVFVSHCVLLDLVRLQGGEPRSRQRSHTDKLSARQGFHGVAIVFG